MSTKPVAPVSCVWCGVAGLPADHAHRHLDGRAVCLCDRCAQGIVDVPDDQGALRGLLELWRDVAPHTGRNGKEH